MAKRCSIYGGIVLYLDCLECDDKELCKNGRIKSNDNSKTFRLSKNKKIIKKTSMEK